MDTNKHEYEVYGVDLGYSVSRSVCELSVVASNIPVKDISELMAAHMTVNSGPFKYSGKKYKRLWMMTVRMVHNGMAEIKFTYRADGWDSVMLTKSKKLWRKLLGKLFGRLKYEKHVFEMYNESDFNKWFKG
jgi:hypothetical protein